MKVSSTIPDPRPTGPAGRAEDIGGPEVRLLGDLAESWVRFKGINKRIVNVPLPGPSASAFRKGLNTVPDKKYGTINWEAYLSRVYGQGRSDG